jgi:isoquinoline 1-oxidoreductase
LIGRALEGWMTVHDVPPIEVVLLNRLDLPSASVGEAPLIALAPAVGNAIFDATGIRLHSLPLVPEGSRLSVDKLPGER